MKLGAIPRTLRALVQYRRWTPQAARAFVPFARGLSFADGFPPWSAGTPPPMRSNPLRDYFERNSCGPGIWKWTHYFDIYHRHLQKFVGREVTLIEIGIYSGGSLGMWRDYLGPRSKIIGVDIEPVCLAYRADGVDVLIGDQGNPDFWVKAREQVPHVDIVIDDGSHLPEHQIVTLEELLPHMAPCGVYICEDTHGSPNYFASYAAGLASRLSGGPARNFSAAVESIHAYPLMTVIEMASPTRAPIKSEKRGSQWAPLRVG